MIRDLLGVTSHVQEGRYGRSRCKGIGRVFLSCYAEHYYMQSDALLGKPNDKLPECSDSTGCLPMHLPQPSIVAILVIAEAFVQEGDVSQRSQLSALGALKCVR